MGGGVAAVARAGLVSDCDGIEATLASGHRCATPLLVVIPANAGIQCLVAPHDFVIPACPNDEGRGEARQSLDPGLRRDDDREPRAASLRSIRSPSMAHPIARSGR